MNETGSGSSRDCPLCGRGMDSTADLRVHLMCNHRKSELTDEMLAMRASREPPAP